MGLKWYVYAPVYWTVFLVLFVLFVRALHIREYNNSEIRDGKVVYSIEFGIKGRMRKSSYPYYEFTYNDGVYASADRGVGRQYRAGEKIQVIFPKNDPTHSRIYNFGRFWLKHIELFLFFVAGLVVFVITRDINPFKRNAKKYHLKIIM